MTDGSSTIDVDALVAIDMHVHVEQDSHGCYSLDQELLDASAKYFKADDERTPTVDHLADYYRSRSIAAVIFTVDATTGMGHPALSSEEIAEQAGRHSDVLIPFGSVDPLSGSLAVRRARSLARDHGVRGFKFHPSMQAFEPNDRAYYPLYEALEELGLPAVFHTGQTGIGAGLRGGGGLRLKYSHPMELDDLAVDFPDLTIICAHPSVPWQEEALAVAAHKPNVYIDLSGWSPKYFPPILVKYANSLLKRKVLFGSDWPAITPDRWLKDFEELDIKPDVRPLILKDNALGLLGLKKGRN
jgi:predicted TIM-barrel fold metal-dependent hydrolase